MGVWVGRLRWVVLAAIAVLGYVAPWGGVAGLAVGGNGSGPNAHLWGVLAVLLGKSGALGVSAGFEVVLGVGIAVAGAGAVLRTLAVGRGGRGGWAALGSWLNIVALSLLMPVSGAVFAVLAAGLWELAVWKAGVEVWEPAGLVWAAVREIYFWGVAGSFAVAGWWYNAGVLAECVVVSAGVGIVVRGLR